MWVFMEVLENIYILQISSILNRLEHELQGAGLTRVFRNQGTNIGLPYELTVNLTFVLILLQENTFRISILPLMHENNQVNNCTPLTTVCIHINVI